MQVFSVQAWYSVLLAFSPFLPRAGLAQDLKPLSISMEEYAYPYKVDFLALNLEGQDLKMAYMDMKPEGHPNGQTVLLLHGKNFFGAYWQDTDLGSHPSTATGSSCPDQIGFGKSAKPNIHYSFHLLAANTKKLLDTSGRASEVAVVGHSMGGMLATRFALMYPEMATR